MPVLPFKILIIAGFISIVSASVYILNSRDRIVFCSGSKTHSTLALLGSQSVVINLGSGQETLSCLQRNLAFYNKEIDLIILTNNRRENYVGLAQIAQFYSIKQVITPPITAKTFTDIISKIATQHSLLRSRSNLEYGIYKLSLSEAPQNHLLFRIYLSYPNRLIYQYVPGVIESNYVSFNAINEYEDLGSSRSKLVQLNKLADRYAAMINSRQAVAYRDRQDNLFKIFARPLLENDRIFYL